MLSRWQGWSAAVAVTLLTGVLVIGDVTDEAMRRWWDGHALTTDTVSGLLVLAITLLVVDQVVRLQQLSGRARAVGAQAAIILVQAVRASRAVSQAIAHGLGPGDRDDATDEIRTYMMMLLVGGPLLIDERASRAFLEQAQAVAGEMTRIVAATTSAAPGTVTPKQDRLDGAMKRLREASAPLVQVLDPATQAALRGDESALPVRGRSHSGKGSRSAAMRPARLPPSLGRYGRGGGGIGRLRGGRAASGGDPRVAGACGPQWSPRATGDSGSRSAAAAVCGRVRAGTDRSRRAGQCRRRGQDPGLVLGRSRRPGRCPGRCPGPRADGAPGRRPVTRRRAAGNQPEHQGDLVRPRRARA